MVNRRIINKIERLRFEAMELWPLTETHLTLVLRRETLELLININTLDDENQLMKELTIADKEYENARCNFIDNYIFSRL